MAKTSKTPLSEEAAELLDQLSKQFVTAFFNDAPANELIAQGYAHRTSGGLAIADDGMIYSQTK